MEKNKPVVAIDVDNTLLDMGLGWWLWLHPQNTQKDFAIFAEAGWLHYNLTESTKHNRANPYIYWGLPDLYDDRKIDKCAELTINNLWDDKYDVIVCSQCEGESFGSKERMISRSLPNTKFVGTRHKGVLSSVADVIIDDRNENLEDFDNGKTLRIRIKTPYSQNKRLTTENNLVECATWKEIDAAITQHFMKGVDNGYH